MTDRPTFVYVTYIESTPEKVWHALTDADLTAAYWGHSNVSDWQAGSALGAPPHRRLRHRRRRRHGRGERAAPRLVTTWAAPASEPAGRPLAGHLRHRAARRDRPAHRDPREPGRRGRARRRRRRLGGRAVQPQDPGWRPVSAPQEPWEMPAGDVGSRPGSCTRSCAGPEPVGREARVHVHVAALVADPQPAPEQALTREAGPFGRPDRRHVPRLDVQVHARDARLGERPRGERGQRAGREADPAGAGGQPVAGGRPRRVPCGGPRADVTGGRPGVRWPRRRRTSSRRRRGPAPTDARRTPGTPAPTRAAGPT